MQTRVKPCVLVVDDEADIRTALVSLLRARGYDVSAVGTGEAAIHSFKESPADAVILDVFLPGLSGQETFSRLQAIEPNVLCIFVTAHGTIPAAVDAIRAGGFDYLTKPFDNERLVLTVARALEHRGMAARIGELEEDLSARTEFSGIIGRSQAIQQMLRQLSRVAASSATVLLVGESGTGKELAAKSVHRASKRATRPFIGINCAAIPQTLAESELFGHERGAFTDARAERVGRFEQAKGGTLFLDEVGDLASEVQVKLLRALEEHEIYRVGGERAIPVDVRLIAATNRDLSRGMEVGSFRDDLYWRLNVFRVELPALRDRLEDLPLLVDHLIDRANQTCGSAVTGVTPAVMTRLRTYSWPGNVRQLANSLLHAVIMATGPFIELENLPEEIVRPSPHARALDGYRTLEEAMAATERQLIEAAIQKAKGNRSAAAAALGITRRTLYNKLRTFKDGDEPEPEASSS